MRNFKIDIENIGNGIECMLTPIGEQKVRFYLREMAAKRKEILDAGIDTADSTNLPTEEDIIDDIESFYGEDGVEEYCNCWGVTDEYNADTPLCLTLGQDIITAEAAASFYEIACSAL